ncbi:unnamed protein product [Cunninghamella echinulata]
MATVSYINHEFELIYPQHHSRNQQEYLEYNQSSQSFFKQDSNSNYDGNDNDSRQNYNHGHLRQHQYNGRQQQHHRRYIHPDDRHVKGSKLFFYPFMERLTALKKVEQGQLYTGQLRINQRKRLEAYVTCDELDDDIFIYGLNARNRALEGDTVIVELVDLEQVLEKKNKNEQRQREQQGPSKQKQRQISSQEEEEKSKSTDQNEERSNQNQHNDTSQLSENEKDTTNIITNSNNKNNHMESSQMHETEKDTTNKSNNNDKVYAESLENKDEEDSNNNNNNVDEGEDDYDISNNNNECDSNVTTVASLIEDDSINIKDNDTITNQDGDDNISLKQRFAGKVVHILSRHQDSFAGVLSIDYPVVASSSSSVNEITKQENQLDENRRYVWFKPNDIRVPFIRIELNEISGSIFYDPDFFKENLVEVVFLRWPITSKYPIGEVIKYLGPIGSMFTEEQAILLDYSIRDIPFDNAVTQAANEISKSIPSFEYKCRRDLRDEVVYTIDPITAKDLDDALHIKRQDDGTFEVGVHIADVSYYVKKHTSLDTEAKKRGTTTYLVGRSIPMLPAVLCERVCSLTPLTDKLTFSVIWKIDNDGNVLDTWFGRTIIRSCAKLSYEDAQKVIEGAHIPDSTIIYNVKKSELEANILNLYQLSSKMRQKRYKNGALSLNSVKLQFTLNEFNKPTEVSIFVPKEANELVEEYMLLANMSVAEKIGKEYPDTALLRCHELPIERRMEGFLKTTMELGYKFDGSSSAALQESFNDLDDKDVKEVLLTLAIQPMKRAKYFSAGTLKVNKYLHYALNVGYYTHFTSPIRRYADIIVHRQLAASLSGQEDCGYTKKTIQQIALSCNKRKDAAKNAQDANIILHLVNYLEKLSNENGPLVEDAIVINTNKNAFDVYVPKYGLEYHVNLNNLPLKQSFYNDGRLVLQWNMGIEATHERAVENYLQKKNYSNNNNNDNQCNENENDDDQNVEEEDNKILDSNMKQLMCELSALEIIDEPSIDTPRRIHSSILKKDKCIQVIDILTKLSVNLFPDKSRSPSQIHIYPINPF